MFYPRCVAIFHKQELFAEPSPFVHTWRKRRNNVRRKEKTEKEDKKKIMQVGQLHEFGEIFEGW
jgi:hypothetical protein